MEWGRIVTPVGGGPADAALLAAGADVARRFEAELLAIYAPPDPAALSAWLTEGYVGTIEADALESLREAGLEGEEAARAAFAALAYPKKRLAVMASPVWRSIAETCRLADLLVFDAAAARGEGPFAETFELELMEERAAALVVRSGGDLFGTAMVAWDRGEPASRAARRAVPLLRHAAKVVIAGGLEEDGATLEELQAYFASRGLAAETLALSRASDMGPVLFEAARRLDAGLMVAGAFGRSRLRELIFGGTTRALLHGERPSLFLAH